MAGAMTSQTAGGDRRGTTRGVPALNRGLDILELLLGGEQLSAPDIAERLGLPRTTVHELVTTLCGRGYLVPSDHRPTRFRLGARLAQLGAAFGEQVDVVREGSVVAKRIAAACEETVNVGTLDGTNVVYLVKVDSVHPIRMVSAVGRTLPAHCTSLGKAMLAELPADRFAELYPMGARLGAMTPHSITTVRELRAELGKVREAGVAFDEGESDVGMWCVGAVVRDRTGEVVAALSISTPEMRRAPANDKAWVELVRDGAAELSARLGFEELR
jgi:DNA-binding IclR family transcriptional regulator